MRKQFIERGVQAARSLKQYKHDPRRSLSAVASLHFYPGFFDHPAPSLTLFFYLIRKVRRTSAFRFRARIRKIRLDVGYAQNIADGAVQLRNDVGRGFCGHENAVPRACGIAKYRL